MSSSAWTGAIFLHKANAKIDVPNENGHYKQYIVISGLHSTAWKQNSVARFNLSGIWLLWYTKDIGMKKKCN